MAIAKNFAHNGIWGVTKYEFTSSSSSILWTLTLSLIFFLFKPNEITPFILNIFFASLVILTVYLIYLREKINNLVTLFVLISICLITPICPLVFTGLEHVFHILISIWFIYLVAMISVEKNRSGAMIILLLCAFILPFLRYESVVLVITGALILYFNKKLFLASAIFLLSVLPLIIFGLHSIQKGWSFFPNSMLLKGLYPDIVNLNDFIGFCFLLLKQLLTPVNISIILFSAGVIFFYTLFRKRKNPGYLILKNKSIILLALWGVNAIMFYIYSRSGWSYRYQSFLVALTLFIVGLILMPYLNANYLKPERLNLNQIIVMFIIFCFSIGYIYQAIQAIKINLETPRSATNIYQQQYQMASFIKKYYENSPIALNDIGASNYYADIKCVDLWGLSDLEISKLRRKNLITVNDIERIIKSNNVKIAILYDSWFKEGDSSLIPNSWYKAGEWTILNNIIAGDSVISFYALTSDQKEILLNNLKSFSGSLPRGVIQTGDYIKHSE